MSRVEPPRKTTRPRSEPLSLLVSTDLRLRVSSKAFWRLCMMNPDVFLERGAHGELVVMPPAGAETAGRNSDLTGQLWFWNRQSGLGKTFDSSAGFTLPNTAVKSPDATWISLDRWQALDAGDRRRFAHIVPDFVAELTSPSDQRRRPDVRKKMAEYVALGVRLAWLIDPDAREVEIHRHGRPVELLKDPETLSGEDVLPGFVLDLRGILFD